ncbi:MAG: FAD-dependent oxidoreductase, partial [Bacteroidia bacterium]|nr:FAD-dependent oxidoreductase [Bacteroidia bacterium]
MNSILALAAGLAGPALKKLRPVILALAAGLSACTMLEVDVLVVGGGTAGTVAAVQASRSGSTVLLIEETPWLGGMLTAAGVSCIDGNYNLRSGLFGEFVDSLSMRYGSLEALKTGWVSNVNFEPHVGEAVFENMVAHCGKKLRMWKETKLLSLCRRGRIWKAEVAGKDGTGRRRVRARSVIDATELGDVAALCGIPSRIGMDSAAQTRESTAPGEANGTVQDMTYVAVLKDFGPGADMRIPEPPGYDRNLFVNSCVNPMNSSPDPSRTLWPAANMISYGRLPGGKYMINWPIEGNDYYAQTITLDAAARDSVHNLAKNFTLGFVYFIQNELGYRNLGIADDEFPTADGLPFHPYFRESRRIEGEAFLTLDSAASPYDFPVPYYRTGVAVGDYAVDHHHYRNPDYRNLPDLHFYPIPSFNVPAGVMLPSGFEGILVSEKSVSVSNLINGATRLQPVVMQLGQAAGAWAALSVRLGCELRDVPLRALQKELLSRGCYLMPYLDLKPGQEHFEEMQRIGATGILRGEGRNVGWANQTWFRCSDPLLPDELFLEEYYPGYEPGMESRPGPVTVGEMESIIRDLAAGGGVAVSSGCSASHSSRHCRPHISRHCRP